MKKTQTNSAHFLIQKRVKPPSTTLNLIIDKVLEPQEEQKGVFSLTDVYDTTSNRKKKDFNKRLKKELLTLSNVNPFEVHGSKEMWDKIVDLTKTNQPVRFPDVGFEKTPIYKLQQLKAKQTKSIKNDFNSRLDKGEFIYKGRVNKLNFQHMYEEIDNLKLYKPRIEKIDPINKNLLSHKLAKAIEQAGLLWGKSTAREQRTLSRDSLNSFEQSMNQLLDESARPNGKNVEANGQLRRQVQSQVTIKRPAFIFTKQHLKIKVR